MEEKNELNDIILNKGTATSSSKKLILAVATLGVILIIVVMLMNTISSNGTDNLPQAVLPPQPQEIQNVEEVESEPLFEEVEIIQEEQVNNDSLDRIAKKLKEESRKEKLAPVIKIEPKKITSRRPKPKITTKKIAKKQINSPSTPISQMTGSYYIQVGSFAKYEPNKKFLDSILRLGHKYKFHKVDRNGKTLNKVLVGPFPSEGEARNALRSIRSNIEAGAFLTKI